MKPILKKINNRIRRKRHVRKSVFGTPECPRLSVFRSNKNIYAQLIDDESGRTLCASSTQEKAVAELLEGHAGGRQAASIVGQEIAKKAIEKGVNKVVFDRNGFLYSGRVKELADGARKGGLVF